jgi:predicted GNAT family N-acyltransferase
MGQQLTLTEALLAVSPAPPSAAPGAWWEVGRLILLPQYRGDVEMLRRCLFLAMDYACATTPMDSLFASCKHVLSRLYRRFGFTAFAAGVPLAGSDKVYTLIEGPASQVLRSLAGKPAGH